MELAVATTYDYEPMPFPFNKTTYCKYEPIEKRIDSAKVLIVNDLLRYETDLSEFAKKDWKNTFETKLRFERKISGMACDNIARNISRLVKNPKVTTVHISEIVSAVEQFRPDAIVMSGTLSDFDYYNPQHLKEFASFIKKTEVPILGICGAHQLISMAFGGKLTTLDHLLPSEKRAERIIEYQYRFVKILDLKDPIFDGIQDTESGVWQDYSKEDNILRVWQNHGLQVEGIPEGFRLLATSYLCKNQMMVKQTERQLIYTVQFHLEKSFEDWSKNPTRWQHLNESRDGRILFENFLKIALKHQKNL
jgi:GMP synthase (glutamine-hydrolysing)